MMRKRFESVDEYINSFPKETQNSLEIVRKTVKKLAPKAEEVISYQVPAFKLNEKIFIYFAGFQKHISIYPAPRKEKEFFKELENYKGGKGTIQFPLGEKLPINLIKRIVLFRLSLLPQSNYQ